jgi:hypothetical protein
VLLVERVETKGVFGAIVEALRAKLADGDARFAPGAQPVDKPENVTAKPLRLHPGKGLS